MPVARPSEQCPNIDPRQPGMVERGTIPSRLDRDASNGSIQVSHIFTDVSGHQTEGPSPQAAEQRMSYLNSPRQQPSPFAQLTLDQGQQRLLKVIHTNRTLSQLVLQCP